VILLIAYLLMTCNNFKTSICNRVCHVRVNVVEGLNLLSLV